jgi:hypothetical protein
MKILRVTYASGAISRVSVADDVMFTFGPSLPPFNGRPAGSMEYAIRLYQGKWTI